MKLDEAWYTMVADNPKCRELVQTIVEYMCHSRLPLPKRVSYEFKSVCELSIRLQVMMGNSVRADLLMCMAFGMSVRMVQQI